MFETYLNGLAGMTRDQLYTERDCFYFTLDAILSHPNNRSCNEQYKLLYWDNDPEMSKCVYAGPFFVCRVSDPAEVFWVLLNPSHF